MLTPRQHEQKFEVEDDVDIVLLNSATGARESTTFQIAEVELRSGFWHYQLKSNGTKHAGGAWFEESKLTFTR